MECVIFFCKNIIDKLKPYVITNYIIDIIGDFIMIRLKKVFNLTEEEIESYTGCSERTQRCLTDCPWPFPGAYINEAK